MFVTDFTQNTYTYADIIPLNNSEEIDMLFDITDGKAIRSQVSMYIRQIEMSDVHSARIHVQ